MRNLAPFFALCLLLFCWVPESKATHLIGGEIEYTVLAPNVYLGSYKIFYDCRSTIPPASVQFNLKSTGCSSGNSFLSDQQTISSQSLNPYCATTGNYCNSNALLNLRMSVYTATFSFTPAQLQCPDWVLSVTECDRSSFANLPDAVRSCLYIEAYINTAVNAGAVSSPGFMPLSDMFVTVNQPATINNLTAEKKNYEPDSVVYSLQPALENKNTPLVYAPGLSFSNPIPSLSGVKINPNNGLLSFYPNVFVPSANPERNAYAVVIQASAYKKVNGIMTKVSTAQRNIPVYIVNNSPNQNPEIVKAVANGQPVGANAIIQVPAGTTLNFEFSAADADVYDSLTVLMPGAALPGFSFTSSGGSRPAGTVTWQAPLIASDKITYFPVMVKDNACPVRGTATQVYGIKVVGGPLGLHASEYFDPSFVAFPNPFTTSVNFRIGKANDSQALVICNIMGQELERIQLKRSDADSRNVAWDRASEFPAGMYLARLEVAGKVSQTLKIIKLQ